MKLRYVALRGSVLLVPCGAFLAALACGTSIEGSNGDGGSTGDARTSGDGSTADGGVVAACVHPLGDGGCKAANPLEWAEWRMPNSRVDVEGGAPNPESYTDNKNGTVTDNVTGLMWQKGGPEKGLTWNCAGGAGTAQDYCSSMTLAGYHDWRLPSVIELVSLLDYSGPETLCTPMVEMTHFDSKYWVFWSSTPQISDPPIGNGIWAVDFYAGSPATNAITTSSLLSARCVR